MLTGGLLAGGLVVGAAGLTGVVPATGGAELASFDMGRLASIVTSPGPSNDEKGQKNAPEEQKGPKNVPEERKAEENPKDRGPYGKDSEAPGKESDREWKYGPNGCEPAGHEGKEWPDKEAAERPEPGKDPKAGPEPGKEGKEGREPGKDPKAGPEPGKEGKEGREAGKDPKAGPEPGKYGEDWDPRCESERDRYGHEAVSVPCDSDELVAALVHANAVGGGTLKLAPKCTYTLTAYGEHEVRYEGQAGRNDDEAPDPANPADDVDLTAREKSGLPLITQPIRIKGEGSTIVRPVNTKEFRFFTVRDGGQLKLSDVTLENGRAANGGSIKVDFGGEAVVEHTKITRSVASSPYGGGGAIFNDGHLTVVESEFTENSAAGVAGRGGGILNGGVATVEKSEFADNSANGYGGGLANYRGAADVSKSTFAHNTAAEGGGFASVSARTRVWDTKAIRNTARIGGGVANRDATLTLRHLKISDNTGLADGGGISTVQGLLTLDDSLVDANTTFGNGGGIFARKTNLIVRKSEIVDNDAVGPASVGGGIFVAEGKLSLFRSKVTGNDATNRPGGIFANRARVEVDENTVIIKNRPTNCEGSPQAIPNCFG